MQLTRQLTGISRRRHTLHYRIL